MEQIKTVLSYESMPPPPPPSPNTSKRPKWGLIVSLLGALVISVTAIAYFIGGNALAGVLGIIFVILTVIFGRQAYLTEVKKVRTFYGMVPMVIGFIVMTAGGSLLSDYVVILGGFFMTAGGILLSSEK